MTKATNAATQAAIAEIRKNNPGAAGLTEDQIKKQIETKDTPLQKAFAAEFGKLFPAALTADFGTNFDTEVTAKLDSRFTAKMNTSDFAGQLAAAALPTTGALHVELARINTAAAANANALTNADADVKTFFSSLNAAGTNALKAFLINPTMFVYVSKLTQAPLNAIYVDFAQATYYFKICNVILDLKRLDSNAKKKAALELVFADATKIKAQPGDLNAATLGGFGDDSIFLDPTGVEILMTGNTAGGPGANPAAGENLKVLKIDGSGWVDSNANAAKGGNGENATGAAIAVA